jgi:hypothetical protein
MRPIFSEAEIELITRNLRDILRIHEDFVSSLRRVVSTFGLSDTLGNSDSSEAELFSALASVLEAISKRFIVEVC